MVALSIEQNKNLSKRDCNIFIITDDARHCYEATEPTSPTYEPASPTYEPTSPTNSS